MGLNRDDGKHSKRCDISCYGNANEVHIPYLYEEIAPENVNQSCTGLGYHWNPRDFHAVEEALFEIELAEKVHTWQ